MPVLINPHSQSLLRAVPFFRLLDEIALADVAREVTAHDYPAGAIIFMEGEASTGLHLVASGLCEVYRISEGGREQVLALLGPGDSCNEVPAVDGGPNPASLRAVEETSIWRVSGESLRRLRQRHPALNEIIIKNLAMRCRQLVQRVYNLSFLSVTGRLAVFLLQQSETESILSRRRWTQDEIAAHLGTVREMVGRSIRELDQAGLIKVDRHRIEVVDRAGLRDLT